MSKIKAFFEDLHDDFDFWKRKDVSLKFKILNMLSGDLLRNFTGFAALNAKELQREWNDIFYYVKDWDNPSEEEVKLIMAHYKNLEWRLDRAYKDVDDIFTI